MVKSWPAIESDLFHERHRQDLVREFATIKKVCQENGAMHDLPLWSWSDCHGQRLTLTQDAKIKAELENNLSGKLHDLQKTQKAFASKQNKFSNRMGNSLLGASCPF